MKASSLFFPTLRQVPQEAEMRSHELLLRGGFIRKLTSGVYCFLPLGWRVVKKVEQITREEMERIGGQEVLLPALQPREIWDKTGRWEEYGPVLTKVVDREGKDFCLGPTHEEVATLLAAADIRSYRQLPLLLYQIQTKFRDELRPRGGLIRTKEFIMKDLYSFHASEEDLDRTFQDVYQAYCRIFDRCNLGYEAVWAEAGVIGGTETREFMVPAESGEDAMFKCSHCEYAENAESARRGTGEWSGEPEESGDLKDMVEVDTPGATTIEAVSSLLQVEPHRLVKTLIYRDEDGFVAALIRGDQELSELKLARHLGNSSLEMAEAVAIEGLTGAAVGFTGPVGLQGVRLVADYDIANLRNFVVGANKDDAHLINVNLGRDFEVEEYADLRMAVEGDPCPHCDEGRLQAQSCIEVGHIFKLGDEYSQVLGAYFQNEEGRQAPIIMGCYGLGVTRLLPAIVETHCDERGIPWPFSVAPFHVIILQLDNLSQKQVKLSQQLYDSLREAGLDVLYDEREERAGVKFKDADLIGIPLQIIVGRIAEKEGKVEVRERETSRSLTLKPEKALGMVVERVNKAVWLV